MVHEHFDRNKNAPTGRSRNRKEIRMRYKVLMIATVLGAFSSSAFALSWTDGQYPAPPAVAARSALPECGFAATHSWGPNGFQLCDARNVVGSNGHRYGRSR
jgi:hypothetical protein